MQHAQPWSNNNHHLLKVMSESNGFKKKKTFKFVIEKFNFIKLTIRYI